MPKPRRSLVCKADTPYYHCVSRCVRKAFLCGRDSDSGRSYEHRRAWVETQIHILCSIFAIDICAYAVMSNHYHLVVRLGNSSQWSDEEVVDRWLQLFRGPILARRFRAGESLTKIETQTVKELASVWRARLEDLSWFMKCLNEPIARKANSEDDCTGHFWESRFKSQALKNVESLLACMAYVDLNPVRAGIARNPAESTYTSIQTRTNKRARRALHKRLRRITARRGRQVGKSGLLEFSGSSSVGKQAGIPFSQRDYIDVVAWTSRRSRAKTAATSHEALPRLLGQLGFSSVNWLAQSCDFETLYSPYCPRVA